MRAPGRHEPRAGSRIRQPKRPSRDELVKQAVGKLLRANPDLGQFILDPIELEIAGHGGVAENAIQTRLATVLDLYIHHIDSTRRVTKDDRRALKAYLKVLERLRVAQSNVKHLHGVLLDVRYIPGDFKLLETTPFQTLLPVDDEIAIVKFLLTETGGGANKRARFAVSVAYDLLRKFKIPTIAKRDSVWCDLAAILYGEPDKDLYHVVCECRAKPTPATQ